MTDLSNPLDLKPGDLVTVLDTRVSENAYFEELLGMGPNAYRFINALSVVVTVDTDDSTEIRLLDCDGSWALNCTYWFATADIKKL